MSITKICQDTDQRLRRILNEAHPAAIDIQVGSFWIWANREDRFPVVALHLSSAIWTVASALRQDPSVLLDLRDGMPTSGRIALDNLLQALADNEEQEGFVLELVSAFTVHRDTADLVNGLIVLAVGMATRLGGWVWSV